MFNIKELFLPFERKELIEKFNRKWAGRELFFCSSIYSELNLEYSAFFKCCMCTKTPYRPPVFYADKNNDYNNFDLKQYFRHLNRIMTWNNRPVCSANKTPSPLAGEGWDEGCKKDTKNPKEGNKYICAGCSFFKKMIVPPIENEGSIKLLTINNFSICNSNCVYCGRKDKTKDNSYKIIPILKKLLKYKLINKDTLVQWGGGEPVICSEFDECTQFLINKKIRQHINSSGIKFSERIPDGMKQNLITLQISPDAGTPETYSSVKRQNGFFKVWENIAKYAQYGNNLIVKYIIFSMNCGENDIKEFIKLCVNSGVKKITIDTEHQSSRGKNSPFGLIGEKEIKAAVLLKKLAAKNSIEIKLSHQWTAEFKQRIELA